MCKVPKVLEPPPPPPWPPGSAAAGLAASPTMKSPRMQIRMSRLQKVLIDVVKPPLRITWQLLSDDLASGSGAHRSDDRKVRRFRKKRHATVCQQSVSAPRVAAENLFRGVCVDRPLVVRETVITVPPQAPLVGRTVGVFQNQKRLRRPIANFPHPHARLPVIARQLDVDR